MATPTPAARLARLDDACARVRGSASITADDVLDAVADEIRVLGSARHAWAARVENGNLLPPRTSTDDNGDAGDVRTPALATLLAGARPVARADGFVALALPGSSGAAEGVVAFSGVIGRPHPDEELDVELTLFASVAGLALEAARHRARVDVVNRAREALLASVSHDLRNPLNTFAMSAGLLRDDLERDDVDAARGISLIARMERATSRMQGLIEDLVEASRIEARKLDMVIREESAAQLVRDAISAATANATEKSAAVVSDALDDDARVLADRARSLQLIAKVLAFEAKATGDGGTIRIGVARHDDAVIFTARAVGPGGVRVSPPEEGRGGLAVLIARGLVEAQRGTFRVEAGDGLAVSFTLPSAKPQ